MNSLLTNTGHYISISYKVDSEIMLMLFCCDWAVSKVRRVRSFFEHVFKKLVVFFL